MGERGTQVKGDSEGMSKRSPRECTYRNTQSHTIETEQSIKFWSKIRSIQEVQGTVGETTGSNMVFEGPRRSREVGILESELGGIIE